VNGDKGQKWIGRWVWGKQKIKRKTHYHGCDFCIY